ncbi:hypothetical protein NYQ29_03500 [Curtobacterium herbarum]|nr:hypothetical protein [Curtobacterium herbarum]MBM7475747.1 hypothetical protein [Curtobacterium herbarum]MCS6543659.1 hypothetical protein [Curtobacterium herbarum]
MGHPRVDDEHAHGGEGDERHTPDRPSTEVHDEHHDRHHGRARDRRVRPHEHDEPEQHDDGHRRTQGPRCAHDPSEQHHEADEDRAVRPGDRGQVGQRRGLHRLSGRGVESGPVADGEPAEERAARLRQVGGDGGERRAGHRAGSEDAGRAGPCREGSTCEEHDAGRRARFVELQLPADGDDRSGRQHARPRLVERGDDPDRHTQTVRPGGPHHDRLERPDHGPVAGREVAVQADTRLQAVAGRLPHDRRHPVDLPGQDRRGGQGGQQGGREGQRRDRPDRLGRPVSEDHDE